MGLNGFIFKQIDENENIQMKKKSWEPFRSCLPNWAELAVLFNRQLLNGSQDIFFFGFNIFTYLLNTIGGPWYFGRVLVPLRLKNQSLYHKILLLQKLNDLLGKVLKPKKIQPSTSKKKLRTFFILKFLKLEFRPQNFSFEKKVFILTSKM